MLWPYIAYAFIQLYKIIKCCWYLAINELKKLVKIKECLKNPL